MSHIIADALGWKFVRRMDIGDRYPAYCNVFRTPDGRYVLDEDNRFDLAVAAEIRKLRQVVEPDENEPHTIHFNSNGWIIAHPLRERLSGHLFDCEVCWTGEEPTEWGSYTLVDNETLGKRL